MMKRHVGEDILEESSLVDSSIRFAPASKEDAADLAQAQARTFDEDCALYAGQDVRQLRENSSYSWEAQMMRRGHCYKILSGSRIIGGFVVLRLGPGRYEVGRIWVEPEHQNRGIGTLAMQFIEDTFPARRWTTDTPAWAVRSQRFYEKMGYRKMGEVHAGDGLLYLYEKRVR